MSIKCPYDFDRKLFSQLVKQADTTYDDLSMKIGISTPSLIQYLNGKATPMIHAIIKISDYFQVPIDVLMGCHTQEEYDAILKGNAEFMYKCRKGAFEDYLIRKKYQGSIIEDCLEHNEIYYAPYPYNLVECIFGEPVDEIINDDQLQGLEQALGTLSPRERRALSLYFEEEKTLKEAGKEFGVTQERIRQIIAKAIRKLRNPVRAKLIRFGPKAVELQKLEKMDAEILAKKERINKHLAELEELEKQALEKTEEIKKQPCSDSDGLFDVIAELDLSVRSYNCLVRANCQTIAQVLELFENGNIFRVRNLGKKSIQEIISKINSAYGIEFNPVIGRNGIIVSYECA